MKECTCKTCRYHKAIFLGVETYDDGLEIPIHKHRCEHPAINREIRTLDFACGLWRDRE